MGFFFFLVFSTATRENIKTKNRKYERQKKRSAGGSLAGCVFEAILEL